MKTAAFTLVSLAALTLLACGGKKEEGKAAGKNWFQLGQTKLWVGLPKGVAINRSEEDRLLVRSGVTMLIRQSTGDEGPMEKMESELQSTAGFKKILHKSGKENDFSLMYETEAGTSLRQMFRVVDRKYLCLVDAAKEDDASLLRKACDSLAIAPPTGESGDVARQYNFE